MPIWKLLSALSSAIYLKFKKIPAEITIFFLYLLLPLFAFWRNFDFSGLNLAFFDAEFIGGYYPDFIHGVSVFGDWKDLFWDPYNMLGMPLLGGIDRINLFYPVKFIFYIIAQFIEFDYRLFLLEYFSLFHLSLAGFFTYIYLRVVFRLNLFPAFFAGLVYAFNGTFIHFTAYPTHLVGPTFLPLVLLFLHRGVAEKNLKQVVIAGIFVSPVLLNGYIPSFIYSNLFYLLYLLLFFGRSRETIFRAVFYLIIANIIGILLSSVVFIPNYVNSSLSDRLRYNLTGSSNHPFYYSSALFYLFPYFFSFDVRSNTDIVYGYVGIVTLIFAYVGARRGGFPIFVFITLAFLFFMLSLGNETYFHQAAYLFVPKYSYFRLAAFLHYLVGFCLAVLSAFGLNLLANREMIPERVITELKFASGLLIFILLEVYIYKSTHYSRSDIDPMIASVFITTSLFLFGFFLFLNYKSDPFSKVVKFMLVLILLLDLFTLVARNQNANSPIDPRVANENSEIADWLRENTSKDFTRVYLDEMNVRYNSAIVGLRQPGGFFGQYPRWYSHLFTPFIDSEKNWLKPDSSVMDMVGIKYFATSRTTDSPEIKLAKKFNIEKEDYYKFMSPEGRMLESGTEFHIYENTDVMGRAFLVGRVIVENDDRAAAELAKNIDFRTEAIVSVPESEIGFRSIFGGGLNVKNSNVTISRYEPSNIEINVDSPEGGFLVLSDSWYPEWEAYIDGEKTTIYRANLLLRGVVLPAGVHRVRFTYNPRSLFFGAVVSLLTAVALLGYLLYKPRKRPIL